MLHQSPLGKDTQYRSDYAPELLYAIPRRLGRATAGIPDILPFHGVDWWTGYELSWLDGHGKPIVAVADFRIAAASPNIIESKSFKLYLNSLNNTRFENAEAVASVLRRDLTKAAGAPVAVNLIGHQAFGTITREVPGENIDDLPISTNVYDVRPDFLTASGGRVEETLCSHLLKSNCPVTSQPDWASVMINYAGPRIDREGLLKYIVSFRNHTGFHEQCVETMFMDIKRRCATERLTVYARYTRRGGLDINPFRSDFEDAPYNVRTFRQ